MVWFPHMLRSRLVHASVALLALGILLVFSCSRYYQCRPPLSLGVGDLEPAPYHESWSAPQWTPDGTHILFSTSRDQRLPKQMQMHVVATDGTSLSSIPMRPQGYSNIIPVLAPNGNRVAFVYTQNQSTTREPNSFRESNSFHIATSELDGSDWRYLTEGLHVNTNPAWSGTGSYIAFHKWADNQCRLLFLRERPSGLYTMKADGSDLRKIVHGRGANARVALDGEFGEKELTYRNTGAGAWSPADSLAFVGARRAGGDRGGLQRAIYTVKPDGSKPIKLAAIPSGTYIVGPLVWAQDGKQIAFLGNDGGRIKVYKAEVDAPDLEEVLVTSIDDPEVILGSGSMSWSSDGSEFLLSLETRFSPETRTPVPPSEHRSLVYRARLDGSELQELGEGVHATWSPDESRIAVVAFNPSGSHSELYTMNADGGDMRVLVRRDEDGNLQAVQASD